MQQRVLGENQDQTYHDQFWSLMKYLFEVGLVKVKQTILAFRDRRHLCESSVHNLYVQTKLKVPTHWISLLSTARSPGVSPLF